MKSRKAKAGERGKKPIVCPGCRSASVVMRGLRHNLKSSKQLFLCRKCGRKFTLDDGFLRMRFNREEIRLAVSLYSKGFSLAEVTKHMERKGVKVSRWTVLLWARKYGRSRMSL